MPSVSVRRDWRVWIRNMTDGRCMSCKHLNPVAWWSLSVLLGVGVAAAVALTPPRGPSTDRSRPSDDLSNPLGPAYVGDAACARCHPAEAGMHQGSGHAHTLQTKDLCDRFAALLDRDFPDPERKGAFRFECTTDGLVAIYTQDGQR